MTIAPIRYIKVPLPAPDPPRWWNEERVYEVVLDGVVSGTVKVHRVESSASYGRIRRVTGHPLVWTYDHATCNDRYREYETRTAATAALIESLERKANPS